MADEERKQDSQTTTSHLHREAVAGVGTEILMMAKREEYDPFLMHPEYAPCVFQKFIDTRLVSIFPERDHMLHKVAHAFGDIHMTQFYNMAMALEHGTGDKLQDGTRLLEGWDLQTNGAPFDVERCTLYYVRFLEPRMHFRWDYEAVTLKVESLIGLAVRP